MVFGLEKEDVLKINQIFAAFPKIEKAIIYGSLAKGNFRPGSDIDLTLVGKNINLGEQFDIENQLDDLLLPYKIDLSILDQINNKELIEHISRVGKVFYLKKAK